MKKWLALLLALVLVLGMAACSGKTDTPAASTAAASTAAASAASTPAASASAAGTSAADASASSTPAEKIDIKFYGKCVEYVSGPMMTDALEAALADKYNIESIQIDWANLDTVVRTGIASGEPCDIYNMYNSDVIASYADVALDLTPYLDADPEFKSWFTEGALASCTDADGRILCLPWETNFTVVIGNKEALEAAGVEIPDAWNYETFMAACKKIQDAGKFPFANATDLNRGAWMYRNALLSELASAGKTSADYAADSPESIAALKNVKALYDNGYMYPGEGAVTVKNDEIKAAFYQGDVLMMAEIAANAKVTADGCTDFTPIIIPWPSSGDKNSIVGSMNCFFIPKNVKNPDAAVEVLRTYLSPDIQKIHAEQGYIPANVNTTVTDPFVKEVLACASDMGVDRTWNAAEDDYSCNNLTADLVLNGGVDTVVANLKAAADAG